MKMEKFVKLMTGHFDNREQFTEMKSAGKLFPYARHVNTVCNDKINNIPENFTGIFMVEESYYETDGKCHASPHLFLITDCDGGIMLSSYEIPAGEDKNTFSYASMKNVEYSDLKDLRSLPRHCIRKRMVSGKGKCESVYPCDDIPVMGEILGDMSGGVRKYGSEWKENFRI